MSNNMMSEANARALCLQIQAAIRKAKRPLRRGELSVTILEAEPKLTVACRYGVEHGMLVRIGHYNHARYDLPPEAKPSV